MRVLALGGAGYIGSATVKNLKEHGHEAIVVDKKSISDIPFDIKNTGGLELIFNKKKPDVIINFAASIGGIKYFHKYPADLLVENEGILCSLFSVLAKRPIPIIQISSSMVFESAVTFPSKETDVYSNPPPLSSYGFQKLMSEVFTTSFNMSVVSASTAMSCSAGRGAPASPLRPGAAAEDEAPLNFK